MRDEESRMAVVALRDACAAKQHSYCALIVVRGAGANRRGARIEVCSCGCHWDEQALNELEDERAGYVAALEEGTATWR